MRMCATCRPTVVWPKMRPTHCTTAVSRSLLKSSQQYQSELLVDSFLRQAEPTDSHLPCAAHVPMGARCTFEDPTSESCPGWRVHTAAFSSSRKRRPLKGTAKWRRVNGTEVFKYGKPDGTKIVDHTTGTIGGALAEHFQSR